MTRKEWVLEHVYYWNMYLKTGREVFLHEAASAWMLAMARKG